MIQIVKIGGNVIDNQEALKSFLQDFAALPGKKILVHGGGKEATRLSSRLGIETKMIEGRRVTDEETLNLVTMVYAGLINKRIVAILQDLGCDAIGLTGADGDIIPARRRSSEPIDYGYVGDIITENINTSLISSFFENGLTPVFCAICHEPYGSLLNCNADSVASSLALACSALDDVRLIYCFEKIGVMRDIDDESSLIPLVTPEIFRNLLEKNVISGGMLPKITNALKAVEKGVKEVRICAAENLGNAIGTFIRNK